VSPRRGKSAPAAESKPARKSASQPELFQNLPVAAVFSFLKETRGMLKWSARDMADTLGIAVAAAREAIPYLSMQGYVRASGTEFQTTTAGETVSGSALPHFLPASVEKSLAALTERIKKSNRDAKSPFAVKKAVAFGDFIRGETRAQAADVGVLLAAKGHGEAAGGAVAEHAREDAFLRELRARASQFRLVPYADWMETRTHRKLI
jgi:predicted transcriptional regulator